MPVGYDCAVSVPLGPVGRSMNGGSGRAAYYCRVYQNGAEVWADEVPCEFQAGKAVTPESLGFVLDRSILPADDRPGYIEMAFLADDGQAAFSDTMMPSFYVVYLADGKKSFFSDSALKFASPPIIAQIAEYRQYVETCPVVRIDRDRDLAESLYLINPFSLPIKARVVTHDGRRIGGIKITPMSVTVVPLAEFLEPGEDSWVGQIQITATNRLIPYIAQHRLSDPLTISDFEHLEAFRGEATHLPAFQLLRQRIGRALANHGFGYVIGR